MAEAQIDPALLDEGGGVKGQGQGRGVKRKARPSGETPGAGATPARTSSRLAAGRGSIGVGVGVGGGSGTASRQKGKGREVQEEEEPSRGEEENLIGSEYKLRGKRARASRSPVKKRSAPKSKQSAATTRMDGLAAAAEVSSQPLPIVPPRPPYPIGRRPFLYPCIRPDLPHRPPPADPSRPFKRFDPHEFDDPKLLEAGDDGLSSDDEDYTILQQQPATAISTTTMQAAPAAQPLGATHDVTAANLADLQDVLGDNLGTELEYDTQAYQSLAALLEASHDDGGLFGQVMGESGGGV